MITWLPRGNDLSLSGLKVRDPSIYIDDGLGIWRSGVLPSNYFDDVGKRKYYLATISIHNDYVGQLGYFPATIIFINSYDIEG